jgi:hypothetical protein
VVVDDDQKFPIHLLLFPFPLQLFVLGTPLPILVACCVCCHCATFMVKSKQHRPVAVMIIVSVPIIIGMLVFQNVDRLMALDTGSFDRGDPSTEGLIFEEKWTFVRDMVEGNLAAAGLLTSVAFGCFHHFQFHRYEEDDFKKILNKVMKDMGLAYRVSTFAIACLIAFKVILLRTEKNLDEQHRYLHLLHWQTAYPMAQGGATVSSFLAWREIEFVNSQRKEFTHAADVGIHRRWQFRSIKYIVSLLFTQRTMVYFVLAYWLNDFQINLFFNSLLCYEVAFVAVILHWSYRTMHFDNGTLKEPMLPKTLERGLSIQSL